MTTTRLSLWSTCASLALLVAGTAEAQEIRYMCYGDGNECEVS